MSVDNYDHNGSDGRRKREVECYLRGEAPPPAELARAPRLQDWRAVIVPGGSDGRLRPLMVLVGRVSGHPHIADGRRIHTSELIWLDRYRRWARSWNRLYRLGAPASDGTNAGESEEIAA